MPEAPAKRTAKPPAEPAPRIAFFVGKGGVGKTTVSAAYALQLARARRREPVILVSSDPAHSLADALAIKPAATPRKLPGRFTNLSVWQVDASREFQRFLRANRAALVQSLEKGTLFTAHELNSFLDTTFPGMAEIGVLLALDRLVRAGRHFAHIVVDTAPFGHTLRLFQIPGELRKLLQLIELSESRDRVLAQSFGGRVGTESRGIVSRLENILDGILQALSPRNAELVLVTTPEGFSLREAQRVAKEFKANPIPMTFQRIVVNRAVEQSGDCDLCKVRARKTRQAVRFLHGHFAARKPLLANDSGAPLIGTGALLAFGEHVFQGKALVSPRKPPAVRRPRLILAEWPQNRSKVTFLTGKGGVGKTTISATTAVCARMRNRAGAITVCSTDPAPSLDDVFGTKIGRQPKPVPGDSKLFAVETDSVALLRVWTQRLARRLEQFAGTEGRGVHVELSFEREFLRALLDLVPPGVDEIFATFEILDRAEVPNHQLIIDMAPTGHALELLRMPERLLRWSRMLLKALSGQSQLGIAQEIAIELAEISQKSRRLLDLMSDHELSQVLVVTLAELLPDRETRRLLEQLAQLGLRPAALFINRVLIDASLNGMGNCARCTWAAAGQYQVLNRFRRDLKGVSLYILPEMAAEPVGKRGLERLAKRVYRFA